MVYLLEPTWRKNLDHVMEIKEEVSMIISEETLGKTIITFSTYNPFLGLPTSLELIVLEVNVEGEDLGSVVLRPLSLPRRHLQLMWGIFLPQLFKETLIGFLKV